MAAVFPASSWGRTLRGTPSRLNLSQLVEMTVHYTGARKVNRGPEQIASYLKAIERSHLGRTDAQYSAVGYNFAVDRWGRIWELRGWDYRNAANGTSSNTTSISVLVLVGVEDNTPTPEIVAALRQLYAEGCQKAGRPLTVRGHQQHKATSCPGVALMALVRSGAIQAGGAVAPPTPVASTTSYTVVRGDSYWRVASKVLGSGSRWKEISDLNGGRALHPGVVIKVPATGGTQPAPAPTPAASLASYTVVPNDSYWRISTKLYGTGTRWMEISDLNGGRALHPGTVLKVRAS